MATQADVREIALSLPGVEQEPGRFAFSIRSGGKFKNVAWVWLERIHPKKARVPNPEVLAIRVADEVEKTTLLGADPDKFFTEPHYNGYPAVLVRLEKVSKPELRTLINEAWRVQAPRKLAAGDNASARAGATRASARRSTSTAKTARTAARGARGRQRARGR